MERTFCVCLSHDVDRIKKTFQFFTHFFSGLKHMDLQAAFYHIRSLVHTSHYWNFEKIMELEKNLGVTSTFFFLNETYPFRPWKLPSWRLSLGYYNIFEPRLKTVIKELDAGGWEVGLHGSYLSFKNTNLLKKEKRDLEEILGHPVFGIRQHYLNLDEQTWQLQADAGFTYDASFGYSDDIGFKEAKYCAFAPLPSRSFWVVPLALMDSCVMKKEDPLGATIKIIDLAEEKGACLVLNWHQRMFNEKEFPGYQEMYLRTIEECLKRKADFLTIGGYVAKYSDGLDPSLDDCSGQIREK